MTGSRSDRAAGSISKFVFGTLCCAAIAACSVIVDTDARKLGALPIACEVGRKVNCPCPDGTTGTQVCNKLARYDACSCSADAGRAGQAAAPAGGSGGH